MLKATVSGSFHRHMSVIYAAVTELWSRGVDVLSPADPRVVDFQGEFLFVASDRLRSIKLVQDRHLRAIGHSDFLWVVCPDGYTGPSTCMEVGYAQRAGIPVYSCSRPLDITVQYYVETVPAIQTAIELALGRQRTRAPGAHVLLDPGSTIEDNIQILEQLKSALNGSPGYGTEDPEMMFSKTRSFLAKSFGLDATK
jgi:hypothetical protein